MTRSTTQRLQDWYRAQCDGAWEQHNGLEIGTLADPGFTLTADLEGTVLESRDFSPVDVQREDEDDWVQCEVEEGQFRGFCGPGNLEEMLGIFLEWAEARG